MWYLVQADGQRVRFCSNYYLAQIVADHKKKQIGVEPVIATMEKNTSKKEFFWDTGSMSLGPSKTTVQLPDNMHFSYPTHQAAALSNFLNSMPPKELFYEFACAFHVICLTIEQFNALLDSVTITGT
jgi:hypothetical protein